MSNEKDIYGGYIDPSFFSDEDDGQFLRTLLSDTTVLPFLSPEDDSRVFVDTVREFFANAVVEYSDVNDPEFFSAINSTVAGVPISISPTSISSIFPTLGNYGPCSVDDIVLDEAWILTKGVDAGPRLSGDKHFKVHYIRRYFSLIEIIDRCLICRSGSHSHVTDLQFEGVDYIVLRRRFNWCGFIFRVIALTAKKYAADRQKGLAHPGKGCHYWLLS